MLAQTVQHHWRDSLAQVNWISEDYGMTIRATKEVEPDASRVLEFTLINGVSVKARNEKLSASDTVAAVLRCQNWMYTQDNTPCMVLNENLDWVQCVSNKVHMPLSPSDALGVYGDATITLVVIDGPHTIVVDDFELLPCDIMADAAYQCRYKKKFLDLYLAISFVVIRYHKSSSGSMRGVTHRYTASFKGHSDDGCVLYCLQSTEGIDFMLKVFRPSTQHNSGLARLQMSQNMIFRKVAPCYYQIKRCTINSCVYDIILAEQIGESMYEYVKNHAPSDVSSFATFFVNELVDVTLV
jgi:hypothetical protein